MMVLKFIEIQKTIMFTLNDVKDLLYKIEQRIYGMEVKIQDLQGSQNILEESLAYINKYLVEKN